METSSEWPRFFRLRQELSGPTLSDPGASVREQLQSLGIAERIRPGQQVAIGAGSRGIANIDQIVKGAVDWVRSQEGIPFVVPAMGSHGGATVDGQLQVLAGYGITPETVGCEIRASMETVVVCQAAEGFPIHFDRHAFQADHVIVINRVKPHTGFTGAVQSGLSKMLLIGLGKHAGAKIYHSAIKDYSFDQILTGVADEVIARCRILAGVAVVENGRDETARIEAVLPSNFRQREQALLEMAESWMARLPFDQADLLIVDRIGKDISGTGMDTNVVGRKQADHGGVPGERPIIKRIYVRSLTPGTHGNASGIGLAEFTRSDLVDQVDWHATYENCLTAGHPTGAMLPIHFSDDAAALRAALRTTGIRTPTTAQVLWIRDTLDLSDVECSEGYLTRPPLTRARQVSPLRQLPFSSSGNLPWWREWAETAEASTR